MASAISKAEYLKRYLEKDKKTKSKKKPKASNSVIPRIRILDKNIGLKSIQFGEKENDDEDEAPVIAEIIDERPEEVKIRELYESSRWKKLDSAADEDDNSKAAKEKLEDQEYMSSSKQNQPTSRNSRHSNSDYSPPRKPVPSRARHDSDSDISPPRSRTKENVKTAAPSRARHDSDSDSSHPQGRRQLLQSKRRHDSDGDISPPRSRTKENVKTANTNCATDSDLSPERPMRKTQSPSRRGVTSKRMETNSDSDLSPPRKNDAFRNAETTDKDGKKRPVKTLSGLKAGLQNAVTLREETHELRARERKQIRQLDAELSGRNAETIVRDRKTGKRRDLDEENREKEEKEKKLSEQQQKYAAWGKGIEQTENKKNRLSEDVYEMSKPLARYRDDEDLDERLKAVIRDDDPMSAYIKKKRCSNAVSVMPEYNGPPPPPNRFAIKPGYRWDGVDRSNGFEKRYFEKHNSTKATQEEAYLWSVQNM